jgi:hypothetical protein
LADGLTDDEAPDSATGVRTAPIHTKLAPTLKRLVKG